MRADERVVRLGLAATRSRAAALIKAGKIRSARGVVTKAGAQISEDAALEVIGDNPDFASRGAFKLQHALDRFRIEIAGLRALDLGASTGGFTDVLLRRGAMRVYAVDVGSGQLLGRLRQDPRVIAMERCDARDLSARILPDAIGLITADLAFISLTKALGPSLSLIAAGGDLVALVKPQFELEPDCIGKGGVVRDPALQRRALDAVCDWLNGRSGWRVVDTCASPIPGGDGNREFLVHARRDG